MNTDQLNLPPEYSQIELQPVTLWETIATIQVAQSLGVLIYCSKNCTIEQISMVMSAGLLSLNPDHAYSLSYEKAYRLLDSTQQPYVGVLASASELTGLSIAVPQFPAIRTLPNKSIVVCPFPVKNDMLLPETMWRAVLHFLRSYGIRVYLLGGQGQWQDECGYTEDDILSEHSIPERLAILAGTELVVGVPNEWTWATTAWDKKMVYLYPDNIPQRRWFPYTSSNYGRMVYTASMLQIPMVINQLRLLIAQL